MTVEGIAKRTKNLKQTEEFIKSQSPEHKDMLSAKKHRCYGMEWQEIYKDLLEHLPYVHEERLILATDLLHKWFTNAQKYWSEQ